MADNVPITAGSGTTVATDDVSGVHYQRVKLIDGTADSTVAITGTSGGALNVQDASLAGAILATAVTVGTSAVTLPASALTARRAILIQSDPTNTAYIYIGGSAVTADAASTGGFMLGPGQSFSLSLAVGLVVYGRSTSASQIVRVIEVS